MSPKQLLPILGVFCVLGVFTMTAFGEEPERMSNLQRGTAMYVLNQVADEIRKNYYDPKYHGIDFEERVKVAEKRITEVNTLTEAMGVIGWVAEGMNDSHTFFIPPPKPYEVEHGWSMNFYGDRCFITAVKPGSDAEIKGLKPGDEVLGWEKYRFSRADLWKIEVLFLLYSPRSSTTLLVAAAGAAPRELQVNASVTMLQKVMHVDYSKSETKNSAARRGSRLATRSL